MLGESPPWYCLQHPHTRHCVLTWSICSTCFDPDSKQVLSLMCKNVFPAYMSVYHVCEVLREFRRGHEIPWNWNYRCLWTTTRVLEPEPGPSKRATSFLYCWAMSSALPVLFITEHCYCPFYSLGNPVRCRSSKLMLNASPDHVMRMWGGLCGSSLTKWVYHFVPASRKWSGVESGLFPFHSLAFVCWHFKSEYLKNGVYT